MPFILSSSNTTSKTMNGSDDDLLLSSVFGRMFCCAATVNTPNTSTFDETDAWIDRCQPTKGSAKSNLEDSLLQMKSKYLASLTPTKKRMNHIRPYSARVASTPLRFDLDENDRRLCHPVPLVDDDDDIDDDILSEISFNGTVATVSITSEYSESVCNSVALYEEDSVGSCIALVYSDIETRDDNEKENIDPAAKDLDTMVEEGLVVAHGPSKDRKNNYHLATQKKISEKKKRLIAVDDEERDGAVFPPALELARVFSSASISHDVEYADEIVAEVDRERSDDGNDDDNSIIDPVITTTTTPTGTPTRPNRFMFYNRSDFCYYRKRVASVETVPTYNGTLKEIHDHANKSIHQQ
jgi:hypothetical protein